MKLLKVLTIVLFSVSLFFSVSYTQENNTGTGIDNLQNDNNTGDIPAVEAEQKVSADVKKESEPSERKKTSVAERKSESRKKENSEKKVKTAAVSVEEKPDNSSQVKIEGDLLLINEGNFKYKRIPDLKLSDIAAEPANSNTVDTEKSGQDQEQTGFLGFSKTASDIIVKGGVLILIFVIFIIYKMRMSGPGGKSSKRRNVLNSYRK